MDERLALAERIAEIKAALAKLEQRQNKVKHTNNPRSRYYVTDYSRLVPVYNGFVAPEVLAMYEV